jgi:hypothetical protein
MTRSSFLRDQALTLAIASSFIGAFACSSSDAESTPPPSAAATTYTTAYCERLDRCRTRASRDSFEDVDTCTRRFLPDIDDEFRSPGTNVTDAMADTCAAKMRDTPCEVLISAMLECQFSGSLDTGAPCGSGYQCNGSSCARATDSSGSSALCGTCSARVPDGSDCTNANCEAGFVCAQGRCKAPAKAGAACDTQPCTPDLQCFHGREVRRRCRRGCEHAGSAGATRPADEGEQITKALACGFRQS